MTEVGVISGEDITELEASLDKRFERFENLSWQSFRQL